MPRPPWPRYGLDLAEVAASRSEDPYVQVGAVVMRHDWSVAGVGYNGAPSGIDIDWSSRDDRRALVIHAEVNALRYVTRAEAESGAVLVTHVSCPACLTVIASYGIKRVSYRHLLDNYDEQVSYNIAKQLGITLWREPATPDTKVNDFVAWLREEHRSVSRPSGMAVDHDYLAAYEEARRV